MPPKLRRESLRFLVLVVSLRLARTARGPLPPLLVVANYSLLIYRLLGRRRESGDKHQVRILIEGLVELIKR